MSDNECRIVGLKDIEKGEIKGLLSEMLFYDGICVLEFHKDYFFDECTHGKNYQVMYEVDIEIKFEKCNNKYYPYTLSYRTIYSDDFIQLDYITQNLYDTLVVKEAE